APDHLVVLRLSDRLLNSLIAKKIDRQVPVRDVILDTPIIGTARIVGQPTVKLQPSQDQARFEVEIQGTVASRTVGRNGPATIFCHSVTYFTATREVVFEPGQGFRGLESKVSAQTQCTTDNVQVSRGGPVGRIMRRRAWEEVAAKHAQATAIVRQRALARITAVFDKHMDEQIAQLNCAAELRAKLAQVRLDEDAKLIYSCSSTPHYVEIAALEGNRARRTELPSLVEAAQAGSPIEVWINKSIVGDELAQRLETLTTDPTNSQLLQALALTPDLVGKEVLAALTAGISEGKVTCRSLDDWLVVQINALTSPEATRTAEAKKTQR
ncbi:MAG TPA: hypothetical protein VGJ26_02165, partial [Pirellulales bacterium]